MIGFFDTSIHVGLLRGHCTLDDVLGRAAIGTIRLSPVVAHELLRGCRGPAQRAIEEIVAKLVSIEPPSWRAAFLEAGRLLPRVWADHESVGLARLQNDILIALTARHTGALLVSFDQHFAAIRRLFPFSLVLMG